MALSNNQLETVSHILTVELNCDHHHEDRDKIVATWGNDTRPEYDDEVLDELSTKLRKWGSGLFVCIGDEEYTLIVDKHYVALV